MDYANELAKKREAKVKAYAQLICEYSRQLAESLAAMEEFRDKPQIVRNNWASIKQLLLRVRQSARFSKGVK